MKHQQNGLESALLPLEQIRKLARNPKRHATETIAKSMERWGFLERVIINKTTGTMISGHGRCETLEKMRSANAAPPRGITENHDTWLVPVDYVAIPKEEEEAAALALNQLVIAGGWDLPELGQMLKGLDDLGALDGIGFSQKELTALLPHAEVQEDNVGPLIDNAAKLQKKWGTKTGQLWEIGEHRLLCGDSTSEADVTLLMDGKRACLFATDPPYLVAYSGSGHPHKWTKSHGRNHPGDKDWSDKYTDTDDPSLGAEFYEQFVAVAVKVAVIENAAWYCWHASRRQSLLQTVWEKHGAFVHQQIIWLKDRPILTRSWYMWQHEPCFFGWMKGKKPKRSSKDYPPSVWVFPTQAPGQTTDHPTQKPVELFAIPMRQHTVKGDLCYEPFSGSGTQLVAAEQLGRVCYAMEKSPPFVAVALERLSLLGLTPKLAV